MRSMHAGAMSSNLLQRVAVASLIALMGLSLAFALVPVGGVRTGAMLALIKILVLAFVFKRVWRADVYAMQWSSMFILLFVAEGVVRATSDPQPSALLGGIEAVVASLYFVAVLAYLRPLKKAARASKDETRRGSSQ